MNYGYKKPQNRGKKDTKKPAYNGVTLSAADKKGRNARPGRKATEDAYFYKRKAEGDFQEVDRQDLVNIGVAVWERKEEHQQITRLIEDFPDCFEITKRPVMINIDEPSYFSLNSRARNSKREESRHELDYLAENEETPDWYEANAAEDLAFDFASAVNRGLAIRKETPSFVPEEPKKFSSEVKFEDIDQMLEELFRKEQSKRVDESSEEEEEHNDSAQHSEHSSSEEQNSNGPVEESHDYFDNLHNNIKKMFYSNSEHEDEQAQEDDEASMLPLNNKILQDINESGEALVVPHEDLPTLSNEEELRKLIASIPPELQQKQKEFEALTPAEQQKRKEAFLEAYGYLNLAYNNVVYDFLNSKQRLDMSKLSQNGLNQNFVEKFCRNKYKIFTMFMQGNMLEKVWKYQSPTGESLGPFISYDMDIWNGESNVFTSDTWVSFNDSQFIPIGFFLNRAPVVEFLVHKYMMNMEQTRRENYQKNRKPQNNHHQGKRVNFHKKNQQPQTQYRYQPKGSDGNENFPALGAAETKEPPKSEPKPQKNSSNEDFPSLAEAMAEIPRKASKGRNDWDDEEFDAKAKQAKFAKKTQPEPQEDVTSNLKKMLGL